MCLHLQIDIIIRPSRQLLVHPVLKHISPDGVSGMGGPEFIPECRPNFAPIPFSNNVLIDLKKISVDSLKDGQIWRWIFNTKRANFGHILLEVIDDLSITW